MNRKTIAIRQFVTGSLALLGLLFAIGKCTACSSLTPAEQKSIAADAVRVSVCQSKGRECKRVDGGDCFATYDDCIMDSGLREGSAR